MTREQAIERVASALGREHKTEYPSGFHHQAESLVDALEVLGVIHVADSVQEETDRAAWAFLQRCMTEVKSPPSFAHLAVPYRERIAGRITESGAGCLIDALRNNGFKIVRTP